MRRRACLPVRVLSRRMRGRRRVLGGIRARCRLPPRSHHRAPLLPRRSPVALLRRSRLRRRAYQAASERDQ
jgi:hypothetical protein